MQLDVMNFFFLDQIETMRYLQHFNLNRNDIFLSQRGHILLIGLLYTAFSLFY